MWRGDHSIVCYLRKPLHYVHCVKIGIVWMAALQQCAEILWTFIRLLSHLSLSLSLSPLYPITNTGWELDSGLVFTFPALSFPLLIIYQVKHWALSQHRWYNDIILSLCLPVINGWPSACSYFPP